MVRGFHSLALVTVLALIEYMILGVMVGQARGRYKIEAPATTGDPMFERYFRVHQNTLESLIVFLPALWICGITLSGRGAALIGLVYIVGRVVYVRGYLADPKGRAAGAMMTFAASGLLIIGSLIGIIAGLV
ncbi:MAG: MAPEG family protein [Candidatus Binatales bacterium]